MQFETPAKQRDFLIYYARVMLREAAARRGQQVQWMLDAAAKARSEAAAIDLRPQADLFAARQDRAA